MNTETLNLILSILKEFIAVIPFAVAFVVALVQSVKRAQTEKNWRPLIKVALNLISEAEVMFDKGADRKEWVMDMMRTAANEINFDLDDESLSLLIDNLVEMSKKVNK